MTRKKRGEAARAADLMAEIQSLRQQFVDLSAGLDSETTRDQRVKNLELLSRVCVRLAALLKAQAEMQGTAQQADVLKLIEEAVTLWNDEGRASGETGGQPA